MTIAVHIRFPGKSTEIPNHCLPVFMLMAAKHPEHHFIFFAEGLFPGNKGKQENISVIKLSSPNRNTVLQHFWYNVKLPQLLKKHRADFFISHGAMCSLYARIPQCIMLNDLSFLDRRNLYASGEAKYLKRFFKQSVDRARFIAINNKHTAQTLPGMFPQAAEKIRLTGLGLKPPEAMEPPLLQNIKDVHTEGKEYFLAFISDATAGNSILLLKAFSLFKKRQLSNMKLVFLLSENQREHNIADFNLYKFRADVKFIHAPEEPERDQLVAAAYAAIYLPACQVFEDRALLPLVYGVPLITTGNGIAESIYGEGALFTRPAEKPLSEYMMLLYKDEQRRAELLHAAAGALQGNSQENAADKLWAALTGTAAQTA